MPTRLLTGLASFALLLVIGCNDKALSAAPPLDRFYFPTGLAVRHEPAGCLGGSAGCQTQLLVVSSNFDLAYDPATGGTLIAVDVGQALADAALPGAPSPLPVSALGAVRIGSFGGELAIADRETCPTWTGAAQALVASRSQMKLYRVDVDAQGGLSCGSDCAVPLDAALADPYGVTVACGNLAPALGAAPQPQALAFVSYLRGASGEGFLSRVDLLASDAAGRRTSPVTQLDLQVAPTGQSVFDAASARLFVSGRFAQTGYTPLRWLELATPGTAPLTVNLWNVLRGSDVRGLALSSDRTRAYLAVRFYDPDVATTFDLRPSTDLAGALVVVDLTKLVATLPSLELLAVVPLDRGATEVRAIARPGQRDLVAVTSSDDSTVTLYDDELGTIARTFAVCGAESSNDAAVPTPCEPGRALLGALPFGLAVEPLAGGDVRLYVGSFDRSWVNVLQLDPLRPTAAPTRWIRIGAERP